MKPEEAAHKFLSDVQMGNVGGYLLIYMNQQGTGNIMWRVTPEKGDAFPLIGYMEAAKSMILNPPSLQQNVQPMDVTSKMEMN